MAEDDDTLPPDAPDPATIIEAEQDPDPTLEHPPHVTHVSDPSDPIADREDATHRDT